MKIALYGYGYWGPNLLRNLRKLDGVKEVILIDSDNSKLSKARKDFPDLKIRSDKLENYKDIDCVIIATPVSTHYDLAKEALLEGKHVLVEKPMTSSVEECEELIEISEQKNVTLMVDHTYLYTNAVQKIKSLVDKKELGSLTYFDSVRINLGLFQSDINVLWDLAPHDLSILDYLVDEIPHSVCATGISHTKNDIHNIAYLTINYNADFIAHISCSWSSPVKVRHTLIGGDKKMVLYNDLETTEKIKIYDSGYAMKIDSDREKYLIDYRIGDVYSPRLEAKEALSEVCSDFLACCQRGEQPIADKTSALRVVKILEAAQRSLKSGGSEIKI